MTTTVRHVSRVVVTCRPGDIDPKVAGPAIVAGAVVAIATAIVVILTVVGKPIDWTAVVSPAGIAVLTVLVGYLRRSSHAELVDDAHAGVVVAANVVRTLEPAVAAALPEIAPEVALVEDGVDTIAAALAEADPATAGAPAPAVAPLP